jgi:hypothetical protein
MTTLFIFQLNSIIKNDRLDIVADFKAGSSKFDCGNVKF